MENDFCYVVTVQTGSSYQGDAMIFDSVWNDKELAENYCKRRFKGWLYDIEKMYFNTSN